MTRNFSYKFISLTVVLLTVFILGNCSTEEIQKKNEQNENRTQATVHPQYIGDESCISCHGKQHEEWTGSHHDWAMKSPDSSSVLGDFNDREITLDGVQYRFYKSKNLFKVSVIEKNEEGQNFIIWKTFGFWPLQQYLVKTEDGKIQTLRASWNSESKNWYHQYKNEIIAPKDWLHWTNGGQRWNTMCADCHSTDVRKNYNVELDQFETTFKTQNVGCEACHGPGSNHLSWTKNQSSDDKGIFNPTDQVSILNQCAPCHSRRTKIKETVYPWEDFHTNYLVQNLSPDFYELDGQIKEEDYVFGSFLSSKMYHEGVKCNDCHNPHSLKLKAEGNNLCLSCHEPKYNSKKHHFHQENSLGADCISCHMPGKNYMGHDFRRDHSFRVPRPDQSVQFGTSNACNQCHSDKSAKWAANKVVEWYGPERQMHFSDFLIRSAQNNLDSVSQKELIQYVSNTNFPEIARSTLVENLQNKLSNESTRAMMESIDPNEHLILNSVLNYFTQESPQARLYFARQFLFHSKSIIRMNAAKLLLDIPSNQLNQKEQQQLRRNESELLQSLRYNADFPVGRLQLGDYYFRKNDLPNSILNYEIALKMDSLLLPVYSNLATAYNIFKQNEKALKVLAIGISKTPNKGQLYYLKGLLHYEMGMKEEAIQSLNLSLKDSPNLIKSYYNLAVIHYEAKAFAQAKRVLEKGLEISPNNAELLDFLNLLSKEL